MWQKALFAPATSAGVLQHPGFLQDGTSYQNLLCKVDLILALYSFISHSDKPLCNFFP